MQCRYLSASFSAVTTKNVSKRLSNVHGEARSALVEKHWLRNIMSLDLIFKGLHDLS